MDYFSSPQPLSPRERGFGAQLYELQFQIGLNRPKA
jgi:hypothetical protein